MQEHDLRMGYFLGQRDMLAFILTEAMDKTKLPQQADLYKKTFGDHFSHKWHTSP